MSGVARSESWHVLWIEILLRPPLSIHLVSLCNLSLPRRVSAHHELGLVVVHGDLVVADGGHVLDDDAVVGVLDPALLEPEPDGLFVLGRLEQRLVQQVVGLDHVVDDRGLADLLGPERLLRVQVAAVVVALGVPHLSDPALSSKGERNARGGCTRRC